MSDTIGTGVARCLAAIAAARGVPGERLRAWAGGVDVTDPDARLPFVAFARLWEHVARALDDDGIVFAVASALRVEDYGLMGLASLAAADIRKGLTRVVRFHRLFTDAGRLAFEEPAGELPRLVWRRQGPLDRAYQLVDESVLACAARHLEQVSGTTFEPADVWVRHEITNPTQQVAFFGVPVRGGAATVGFTFDRAWLTRTPRLANPALAAYLAEQAERELATLGTTTAPSWAERTAAAIVPLLVDGEPEESKIARRLATSTRTLRRRLANEGTRFRDVVDRVRRDRATALLAAPQRSLTEIAFELGYSEQSAFSRAFRRWFAVAPGDYRRGGNPH